MLSSDISLADLFNLSDEIGDKYLTPDEVEDRTVKLQAVYEEAEELGVLDE